MGSFCPALASAPPEYNADWIKSSGCGVSAAYTITMTVKMKLICQMIFESIIYLMLLQMRDFCGHKVGSRASFNSVFVHASKSITFRSLAQSKALLPISTQCSLMSRQVCKPTGQAEVHLNRLFLVEILCSIILSFTKTPDDIPWAASWRSPRLRACCHRSPYWGVPHTAARAGSL